MLKDSKGLLRNTIVYFIPFVIMSIIAVIFLQQTFMMLEKKNFSLIKSQVQGVLEKIEDELSLSIQIANEICVDQLLNRQDMEKYDIHTLSGISKMQTYKSRMNMCSDLFVLYQLENIVTEKGTSSLQVFVREQLKLSEEGENIFYQLIDANVNSDSAILQQNDGSCYLFLLYYYPQSTHIEEKRIGFLVEVESISARVQEVLQEIDCQAVLYWNEQIMAQISSPDKGKIDWDKMILYLDANLDQAGYTISSVNARYWDMTIVMAANNRVLRTELLKEGIKMACIGFLTFITLSVFLWLYGKYRYKLLKEIKEFALDTHPEFESLSQKSEYEIIRKVLEKDLQTLNRNEEDIQSYLKESRRQLTWLILTSNPPYELNVEELMENYGIPKGGPYYGIIEVISDAENADNVKAMIDIPEVIMTYNTRMDNSVLFILCISLDSRDGKHEKRLKIVDIVREKLKLQGYICRKIACGLIYTDIKEIHNSHQEALTLLQEASLWKKAGEVNFFDEKAHVIKRVPHTVSEMLETFSEYLAQADLKNINKTLDMLKAMSESASDELVIYVRYKIVAILLEVASEKQISDKEIRNMMVLSKIENTTFDADVKKVIEQTFGRLGEKSPEVEQIMEFIKAQCGNPELGMQMLVEHFKVSERSISRIMKKGINKTYKEYLNSIRFEKACELLEDTDWGIHRVANEVGFYDVSGFYKAFKQMSNLTPDEYRNSKK